MWPVWLLYLRCPFRILTGTTPMLIEVLRGFAGPFQANIGVVRRLPSSGMWRRVDVVWTDVSEERIASIFRVEKSASEEPAWAGGCSESFRLESYRCVCPIYFTTAKVVACDTAVGTVNCRERGMLCRSALMQWCTIPNCLHHYYAVTLILKKAATSVGG
jgi:hypothetical protein